MHKVGFLMTPLKCLKAFEFQDDYSSNIVDVQNFRTYKILRKNCSLVIKEACILFLEHIFKYHIKAKHIFLPFVAC